jgi:aspartate aminotransferase
MDQHMMLMDTISKRYSACGQVGALVTKNEAVYNAA